MARESVPNARRVRRSALCVALLIALPGALQAAKLNYSVGGFVEHSDNLALTEVDPQAEQTIGTDVQFDYSQTGRNTVTTARGGVEYLYYTGNIFDDDIRATLVGHFDVNTMEDRLKFSIEDYANYEPIDILAANAPNNQQQVNVFVAGAGLMLRPGAATRTRLDIRYNNYYAEETEEFNGDRYSAAFSVLHDPSMTTHFIGAIEGSEVRYDQTSLGADYRRLDLYGVVTRNLAHLDLELRLGYSWVELLDFNNAKDDAPLVRAVVSWRASPRSTLDTALYYQFADAAQELITRSDSVGVPQDVPNQNVDDLLIGPDLYKMRRFELGYRFAGTRFDFSVRPYYEDNDYADPTVQSEGAYGIGLGMNFRIQPTLIAYGQLSRSYRNFDNFDRDDDDFSIYLGLTKLFTAHWSAGFELRHQERDSSAANATYDENAATVSVRYTR